jgi:hypothetical protein
VAQIILWEETLNLFFFSARGDNSKIVKKKKYTENFFKNILQNQHVKFNQTWFNLSLGEGDSSFFFQIKG